MARPNIPACGERHPRSKLTEAAVLKIRALAGDYSHRTLAARFGVTHATVRKVLVGATWKHV